LLRLPRVIGLSSVLSLVRAALALSKVAERQAAACSSSGAPLRSMPRPAGAAGLQLCAAGPRPCAAGAGMDCSICAMACFLPRFLCVFRTGCRATGPSMLVWSPRLPMPPFAALAAVRLRMAQHVSTRPPARLTRQLLLALLPACGLRAQAPAPVWHCPRVFDHMAPTFALYMLIYSSETTPNLILILFCTSCVWFATPVGGSWHGWCAQFGPQSGACFASFLTTGPAAPAVGQHLPGALHKVMDSSTPWARCAPPPAAAMCALGAGSAGKQPQAAPGGCNMMLRGDRQLHT
jgi:hypothetical protein